MAKNKLIVGRMNKSGKALGNLLERMHHLLKLIVNTYSVMVPRQQIFTSVPDDCVFLTYSMRLQQPLPQPHRSFPMHVTLATR